MQDFLRAETTVQKARRGELPAASTSEILEIAGGCALPCNGCGETIEPTDECNRLTMVGGLNLRFHRVCFFAWAKFARPSRE